MSRRPSAAHALAEQAARAIAEIDNANELSLVESNLEPAPSSATAAAPRGRPKGKREVEARLTLYLDARRHEALRRLAADRGRSIHSLVIEAVDALTGKPVLKAWE